MLVPGQVENWNIVMDLEHMSLLKINISAMKKMVAFLSSNLRGRAYRMYIINAPSSINFLWNIAKTVIPKDTQTKIQITKDHKLTELHSYCHPS